MTGQNNVFASSATEKPKHKAAVVGMGNMGVAIAYGMSKLGFDLTLVEVNPERKEAAEKKLVSVGTPPSTSISDIANIDKDINVIVSAATYNFNPIIAKKALENGIPYVDLGGDPDTSHRIQDLATTMSENSPVSVFTDSGLAPGLVNIIAENLVEKKGGSARNVLMRVGGLPLQPAGALNYALTWSVEGLRNEYMGQCEVLRDGKFVTVEAVRDVESLTFPELGQLESFATKGGSAHSIQTMASRGVQNCEYRTMRFPGHAKLISFLIHDCKLDAASFDKAIRNACSQTTNDQVLIAVDVDDDLVRIRVVSDDNWTAMQKATAFPTAAIASLIAKKEMPRKPRLDYMDIPVAKMEENMQKIGGLPVIF